MDFYYTFPAVKGIQANREYYIAMVPLRMIEKLFPDEEEYVPPEYRAQRKLNVSRIPSIKDYILENRDTYVFSALTASIDGVFEFVPSEITNVGSLKIDMNARFLINDGQHRKAALLESIREDDSLLNETISVVFFKDEGLKKSQQMFTDLNKHAVKTSNSIAYLYDSRNSLAVITREIISEINFLNTFTDKEKDNLGKYSSNLFTISTFYKANNRIIKTERVNSEDKQFLLDYWNTIVKYIIPWTELQKKLITKVDLRENYIVTQSVIIQVFGRLGNYFYKNIDVPMDKTLEGLITIDWSRHSSRWNQRVVRIDGRIINNEKAIILTCNEIKKELGIHLDANELSKEKEFESVRGKK